MVSFFQSKVLELYFSINSLNFLKYLEIRKIFKFCYRNKVFRTFLWIPSHCGPADNKRADEFPKAGTVFLVPSQLPTEMSDVITVPRTHILFFNTPVYLWRVATPLCANQIFLRRHQCFSRTTRSKRIDIWTIKSPQWQRCSNVIFVLSLTTTNDHQSNDQLCK